VGERSTAASSCISPTMKRSEGISGRAGCSPRGLSRPRLCDFGAGFSYRGDYGAQRLVCTLEITVRRAPGPCGNGPESGVDALAAANRLF